MTENPRYQAYKPLHMFSIEKRCQQQYCEQTLVTRIYDEHLELPFTHLSKWWKGGYGE